MADTNTYQSFENIRKYTTQEHFDAIDKSDVPIGTEYNIVGLIEEEDLSTALRTKINSSGDGVTSLNGQVGALTLKTVFGNGLLGSGDIPIPSATASTIGGISLTSTFAATSSKFGIVKLGSDTVIGSGAKIYPIQLNSSGQMFVSVPWTDTDTLYSAGVGLLQSGNVFKAKLKSETLNTNSATKADITANRLYAVEVDKDGYLSVTVPWIDNNTTYTAGNGISISNSNAISLKMSTTSEVGGFVSGTYTGANGDKTTTLVMAPNGLLDISIDCGTWA